MRSIVNPTIPTMTVSAVIVMYIFIQSGFFLALRTMAPYDPRWYHPPEKPSQAAPRIKASFYAGVSLCVVLAFITYGGLLGIFVLGRLFSKPGKGDAMIGFFTGLISLLFMVEGALQEFMPGEGLTIAWPLYTLVGAIIVIAVANASYYVRKLFKGEG